MPLSNVCSTGRVKSLSGDFVQLVVFHTWLHSDLLPQQQTPISLDKAAAAAVLYLEINGRYRDIVPKRVGRTLVKCGVPLSPFFISKHLNRGSDSVDAFKFIEFNPRTHHKHV